MQVKLTNTGGVLMITPIEPHGAGCKLVREATEKDVLVLEFVEKTNSAVYSYALGYLYSIFKEKEAPPKKLKMVLREFFNATMSLDWFWNWDTEVDFAEMQETSEDLFGDLFIRMYSEYNQDQQECHWENVEGMLTELFDKLREYGIFAITCQDVKEMFPDDYHRMTTVINPINQRPGRKPVTNETKTRVYGFRFENLDIVTCPVW